MALSPSSSRGTSSGSSIAVTDGTTSVNPTTVLDLTSGATVTDGGAGQANVAIASGGASLTPTATKSGNYSATAGQYVPVSAAATITLPSNPPGGTLVGVENISAASTVTVAAGAGDTIDTGGTGASLTVNNRSALYCFRSSDRVWFGVTPVTAAVLTAAAADGSVVVAGTTAVTVRTGTLDAIATAQPPAAAVALNSQKITGLAAGTANGNAVRWEQTVGLVSASGDLLYGSAAATLAKLAKGSDGQVLTLAAGLPSWAAAGGTVIPTQFAARLTLTSGTPVTTADVTAAGTIYLAPFRGAQIALYSGSVWAYYTLAEISLALTVTSGSNYDVFVYSNAGTPTLELSAAWSNDTTRTDALTLQDGVYVKSGATTRRYVGTIRASGTNQTSDAGGGVTTNVGGQRYVWNYYNRVKRFAQVIDTTDSWAYTTLTWRQARATAGNKIEYVCGIAEDLVEADVAASVFISSVSAGPALVGVGLDSTSAPSGLQQPGAALTAAQLYAPIAGHYKGFPGIGYHALNWIEKGSNASSCSFLGDNGADGTQSGLLAAVWC